MFSSYRFDDPDTDKYVRIGGWSYVWAGLFGAVYVVFKAGLGRLPQALVWSAACGLGLIGLVALATYLPAEHQVLLLVLGAPAILTIHAVKTMGVVRTSYRQRRWMSHRED